jgi:SAM-dependent methyltransferase
MRPSTRIPSDLVDEIGSQTLHRIETMGRFNRWMSSVILPYVAGDVLEIGCGIGNISQFLVVNSRTVVGLDLSPEYIQYVNERLRNWTNFRGYVADITGELPSDIAGRRFDTIVMLNVLEHIQDEHLALRKIALLCRPEGRFVCLVPAHRWLYGSLDAYLGHYRRYDKEMLRAAVARVGFQPERCFHFNAAGIPGWWLNGRVFRAKVLPANQLALYDRLVWVFRILDMAMRRRVGQSLIMVARNGRAGG